MPAEIRGVAPISAAVSAPVVSRLRPDMVYLPRWLGGVFLLLWIGVNLSAQPGEEYLLDPTKGEIDGQMATAVYPAKYRDSDFEAVLPPGGYNVHLSPNGETTELVFPTATWFNPPPNRYRIWVESEWEMTPYSVVLGWAGGEFKGRAPTAALPVAPAGRVIVPSELVTEETKGYGVRFLRAEDHVEGDLARWELTRYRDLRQIGDGVLMPEGKAVAGLWDGERYLALSRPFEVEPGETVAAPLEVPDGDAFLVVSLDRETVAWKVDDFGVSVDLVRGMQVEAADLIVETAARVYALWYDLKPGAVELRAETGRETLPPQTIDLKAGEIERFAGRLVPRPDLEVELLLPPELEDGDLSLAVRSLPEEEVVAKRQAVGPERHLRFEDLPSRILDVELSTRFGAFSRRVDLREGVDAYVLLEPELTVISGHVYRGDERHPGELTFTTTSKETVRAETDPVGGYEVLIVEPVRFVSVELSNVEGAPFVEFFPHALAGRQELDLRVPAADFRLEVVDAWTGQGIAEATVHVRNYLDESVPEGEEDPKRAVNQLVTTDDAGWVSLPPLRKGSVEFKVSAPGYARRPEPTAAEIFGADAGQTFRVALEPLGETVSVQLRLADGRVAAGAEVILLGPGVPASVEYSAQADRRGEVRLPYPAGEARRWVARHPEAGFRIGSWSPARGEESLEAVLPPKAEHPLTLLVVDAWGEEGVGQAGLTLRVGDQRLTGSELAWATFSRVNTDESGSWTGYNLPRSPITVLAWHRDLREVAYSGGLDAMATRIDYPWRGQIAVEAIQ